jgi:predicted TPR repeat methyltransferase
MAAVAAAGARQAFGPAYFDTLFERSADPWGFREHWYERRKRALTLACLPRKRFVRGFEPGCANGELSAALAARCDELVVADFSEKALALSAARLADFGHVRLQRCHLPQQWPDGRFDLIVIAEIGYYFDDAALDGLIDAARQTLTADGVLLASHWRHPVDGAALDGNRVHARVARRIGLPRLARHRDRDLLIDVWTADSRSVAQRGGRV